MDSVKADHGYNMDSKSVKNLLQTMSELDVSKRRDFLQFTTGSPKLPIGGMSCLTHLFQFFSAPPPLSLWFSPLSLETAHMRLILTLDENQGSEA